MYYKLGVTQGTIGVTDSCKRVGTCFVNRNTPWYLRRRERAWVAPGLSFVFRVTFLNLIVSTPVSLPLGVPTTPLVPDRCRSRQCGLLVHPFTTMTQGLSRHRDVSLMSCPWQRNQLLDLGGQKYTRRLFLTKNVKIFQYIHGYITTENGTFRNREMSGSGFPSIH